MKKVAMIANKSQYFEGRTLCAEEPFGCEERFVQILTLSGAARRDESAVERGKRRYKRRDMVAEDSSAEGAE